VQFRTSRKPSKTDLTAVRWRATAHRNEETVRVATTADLGNHAQAILNVSIFRDA